MRLIDHLAKVIRAASAYNPDVQERPACILWPDRDRQWTAALPTLLATLPELYVLGDYAPETRTGPAIWLRCVLANLAADPAAPPPIFYLPGFSRQDLRAVDSCPETIKPFAELQYRGVIWSQVNARDWTLFAFLKSEQGGLRLDVASDNEAKNAMQLALNLLLDEEVEHLRSKHLNADYFHTLLSGDPVRECLQWLNLGDQFRQLRSNVEWRAFVEISKSQLAFDPENQGVLAGAALLATHQGPWRAVWERYCEAPQRYPQLPQQIRRCMMPTPTLFASVETHDGWPQWNESQENALRTDLGALIDLPAHAARQRITELENQHAARRYLVWAALGEAALALALEHLAALTSAAAQPLAGGAVADLVAGYCQTGWRADAGLTGALAAVSRTEDVAAVTATLKAIYLPWAEESARYLQKLVDGATYPGGTIDAAKALPPREGECILFVDGLRYDVARRLVAQLTDNGYTVEEIIQWAALPSVTATGKPAVTPVKKLIHGQDVNVDFEPAVAATGQSLKGGHQLTKLLKEAGWQTLEGATLGTGQGRAWCEFGDIDHTGHNHGWQLVKQLDGLVKAIGERVQQLLAAGWRSVRIVTDHGWLLFPDGLPKVELASALADNKWGRCAAIKAGSASQARIFPWYWNPIQQFALADGVGCYRAGIEYAHGGLSLQECLTLTLVVGSLQNQVSRAVTITDVGWKQLRCTVAVEGDFADLTVDVRRQPGNPATSVVVSTKLFKQTGVASVVVEDDDLAGKTATVVVLDAAGALIAQLDTVIGGGE